MKTLRKMVGTAGFEPTTPTPPVWFANLRKHLKYIRKPAFSANEISAFFGNLRPFKSMAYKPIGIQILALLMTACASSAAPPLDIIKTVTLQYNPAGARLESIEVAKAVFAAKGWIEAQLPVEVTVLDPALNVDLTRACELRFVDSTTLLSLALDSDYRNKGLSRHTGPGIYPCQILLRDTMTDVAVIQLILQHELGHIILDQSGHSTDPHSIMSNGVSLPGRYRFTDADARSLSVD